MTGLPWLDWAIITISLVNTTLLLWLGLTVLLNADRNSPGVWLMGGGLLLGAAFFVSHTAILGQSFNLNLDGLNFWWQFGWIPVTAAPFAWYIVILWYGGFWNQPRPLLFRRHLPWLSLTAMLGGLLIGLMLLTQSIPAYENVVNLNLSGAASFYGVPLLVITIPVFMVLCIGLSVDVLLHPAPTSQPSGELARQRSRPWLLASAVMLLAVSLLVVYFIIRIMQAAQLASLPNIHTDAIGVFDLVLSSLITISTLMLGQAIVAYEVFTGRVLPRRELANHWRYLVLLAFSAAALISWSITAQLRPIYSLLLTTLLMVTFYALYSWRSFVERDRFVQRLRPFVGSQHLLTQLLNPNDDDGSRAYHLYRATCSDVLRTDRAQLVPLGPFCPLIGVVLTYPNGSPTQPLTPPAGMSTGIQPINPDVYGGFCWVIPLWTERGLIGALFIGTKLDGGVYSQEEIEVAQASSERILDMLAGEQIARRLVQIQRRRQAETRVMDFRTRRQLHDVTLPTLHGAILQLSSAGHEPAASREVISTLTVIHQQISDIIRLPSIPSTTHSGDTDLLNALRALFEAEFSQSFEQVEWQPGDQPLFVNDPLAKEVLLGAVREIMRNAAVHGRGTDSKRPISLTITVERHDVLYLRFTDNGVGLDATRMDGNLGGSGAGLELHRTLLAVIGGECFVEPAQPNGTQATIVLPWSILAADELRRP